MLRQLREQLERGAIDDDLKRQLGVTEEDLRRFAERLEQRLSETGAVETPEERDRRLQFEEMLRGLEYESRGARREGEAGPRRATQGAAGVRREAPPEYRDQERAYREKLTGGR